jgi:hypothetical protein
LGLLREGSEEPAHACGSVNGAAYRGRTFDKPLTLLLAAFVRLGEHSAASRLPPWKIQGGYCLVILADENEVTIVRDEQAYFFQ